MRNFIFVLVLVIIPMFFFTAMHLQKDIEEKFLVTEVSGPAFVQYKKNYSLEDGTGNKYTKPSTATPLTKKSKLGSGDMIITDKGGTVDLLLEKGLAIRIKEHSWVTLTEEHNSPAYMQATMKYGKVLAKASKKLTSSRTKAGRKIFKVKTPNAVAGVRGTKFMVNHPKKKKRTSVSVKEGLVNVRNPRTKTEIDVPAGKRVLVTPTTRKMILMDASTEEQDELNEVEQLKAKVTTMQKVDQAVDLDAFKDTYDIALVKITEYELAIFVSAISDFSKLKWNGKLPDSIKAIKLESGDYKDPWDTDYFYDKLSSKQAVLISAGPDKVLHSRDDIFKSINLN